MATNNIEKLYELAGVKEKRGIELTVDPTNDEPKFNEHCVCYGYPPFTESKQLNLIKWFSKNIYCIELSHNGREFEFYTYSSEIRTRDKDFSQALASFIYYKWKDLTPEQKKEVRGILE